jgi:predicted ATPase
MFNISVDNFRGFQDKSLDISNINILIGENSGGKSSFIKLLLLKQSMESPNKNKKIIVNGHLLDLGNFDSFINHSSDDKTFSISLKTGDEYIKYFIDSFLTEDESVDEFTDACSHFLAEPTTLTFVFNKDSNEKFTNNIKISNKNIGQLVINITDNNKDFTSMESINGEIILEHIKYNKIAIKDKLTVFGFMFLASTEPFVEYDEANNTNIFNEFAFLLFSQNYFAMLLRNIRYINPIKFQPTRILLKRDNSRSDNIQDYESFINILASHYDSRDAKSIEIIEQFNNSINELGIADEIKLVSDLAMPVTELKVKVSGIWNSIIDVGYGVGLQVPILLQAIISNVEKSNNIIIIEQPEIHLHPALHSKFIEVLVKYSGNTKFIIETHSEHIIRKLQVLVKNKTISKNEIQIYYFKNNQGKFDISRHHIDGDGQMKPTFPKGFYDNAYSLSKELY